MSPISTSAKAVASSLKGQPLVLALVLINMAYMALGAVIWRDTSQRRAQVIDKLLTSCFDQDKPVR